MSENPLIAKYDPNYPLKDHLLDVANCTQEVLQRNNASEKLQYAGWIAGLFHDLGKANPTWQTKVKENSPPKHSDLSAYLSVSMIYSDIDIGLPKKYKYASILAVLHHHTSWTNKNMKTENTKRRLDSITGAIQNIETELGTISDSNDNKIDFTKLFDEDRLVEMGNTLDYIRYELTEDESVMELAFSIYTALRQSDWHESSNGNSPLPQQIDIETISNSFDQLRPFQKKIKENSHSKSLIGLAGCGEGKTYSAMLWGKEQRKQGKIDRLIFAMPTQVTTNNLYTKISNFTDPSETSIYHSSAKLFEDFESNTGDDSEIPSEKLDIDRAKLYQAPFNITTVDHVLNTIASNFERSPIAYDNLRRSGIVFDEIHAYDEQMVGSILGCIQKCQELDIPYYVMSATIPDRIQNEINPETRVVSNGSIEESTGERSPFTITVRNEELTIEQIKNQLTSETNKLMVVKNTVREAQETAKKLQNQTKADIYYYSSEFTSVDRKKKESEIINKFSPGINPETPRILVCTQVCEISLDLSADKLLTDIAPIDSIFQRAGRTHREGVTPDADTCQCPDCEQKTIPYQYNVIVYDTTESSEHIYPYAKEENSNEFELLEQTAAVLQHFGTYTFSKSLTATTQVYKNYPFNLDSRSVFLDKSCSPKSYFKNNSINFRNIQNSKTKVLVSEYSCCKSVYSPKVLLANDLDIEPNTELNTNNISYTDLSRFIKKYSVPIPTYWIHSDDILVQKVGSLVTGIPSPIYNLTYSYSTGVSPPQNKTKTSERDHQNF